MVARAKKRAGYDSCEGETSDAPENLVGRGFHAPTPNELWPTDITEFGPPDSKVYPSPIPDRFDGGPAARPMGASPNAGLASPGLGPRAGPFPRGGGR